ncbi:lipopolysaccharide assembly protein LapA domain-containing protein [Rheinheimera marina]|uniref:Lipopolysaccharide assembly protein LapA domain-containing protein n=1 Tax=Rheinheimera marina TaxID=1774958 RepID=A0ABV9JIM4_9GAMM
MLASLNQHSTILNYVVGQTELRVSELAALFLLLGFVLGLVLSLLFILTRRTRRWLNKSAEQR